MKWRANMSQAYQGSDIVRCMSAALCAALCAAVLGGCAPAAAPPAYAPGRFVPVRADGVPIAIGSAQWHCVWDKQSGLLWEIKDANENPHSSLSAYSWYDGVHGKPKGGTCAKDQPGMAFVGYSPCDTNDLQTALREQQWCGARDWRLPSTREWHSLLLQQAYPGEVRLPLPFFPGTPWGPYWTSEQQSGEGRHGALTIHLGTGEVRALRSHSVAYVMLVASREN